MKENTQGIAIGNFLRNHRTEKHERSKERLQVDFLGNNPVIIEATVALKRNPAVTLQLMQQLAVTLIQYPHLPLKTTINLGGDEATHLDFEDIHAHFMGKVLLARKYHPDDLQGLIAEADSFATRYFQESGIAPLSIRRVTELSLPMTRSVYEDDRLSTPILNQVTAQKLFGMIEERLVSAPSPDEYDA